MLPIPTWNAHAAVTGAVALLFVGALASSWPVALLGGVLMVGL